MRNTTDRLKEISKRLRHYKKVNPAPPPDPYEGSSRHNYCHLVLFKNDKPHLFEVRGFKALKDKTQVSAVNWTLAAGTCTIDLTAKIIKQYNIQILEDNPTIQTLF
jgi:hypothetical protein